MEKIIDSISANTTYPMVCLNASLDDELFDKFKTIPEYTQILEHTSYDFAKIYLDIIKRDNPQLLNKEYLDKFKENDLLGTPNICNFGDITISPSTLGYIKVLSNLIKFFGNLDGFKIAEIGGGYGGQCKIITEYFNIKEYNIVDMHEANQLTNKYLNKLGVSNFRTSTSDSLVVEDYDLIISNYAYTELSRDLQDHYKHMIIDNSNRGYITCNFIPHLMQFSYYTKEELLNLNSKIELIDEEPLTAPDNFIILWKN